MARFVELPTIELNHRGADVERVRWFCPEHVAWLREEAVAVPAEPKPAKKEGAPVEPEAPSRCLIGCAGQTFTISLPLLDLLAVLATPQDD